MDGASFPFPPGRYQAILKPGVADGSIAAQPQGQAVDLGLSAPGTALNLTLEESEQAQASGIRITILDADGLSVPELTLTAYPAEYTFVLESTPTVSGKTDANGQSLLRGLDAGGYHLVVKRQDGSFLQEFQFTVEEEGAIQEQTFSAAGI